MDMQANSEHPQLKPSVILTGTAEEGRASPPIGVVDIGASEGAYFFRVALPGVQKDQSKLKCEIKHDGRVHIEGVTMGPRVVKDSKTTFQMKVQQLCPPGPFTVTFNLPGLVDPRLSSPTLRPDGILEVVVMKYTIPPADCSVPPS